MAVRILVTGATGYVGGRLVPRLLDAGHEVHVFVRSAERVQQRPWSDQVTIHVGDMLHPEALHGAPPFDVVYYLVHGMADGPGFEAADAEAAALFAQAVETQHMVYLGGLQPPGEASAHLRSRAAVGRILAAAHPTTEFRAGPIIGSGSASFEMCRYLTERLPVMVTPRWVSNKISPIAIRDVLAYLLAAIDAGPQGIVDIAGDELEFRQMMQQYAEVRGLPKRRIIPTPVLAPTLAGRWVQFITPVSNKVALPIIEGIKTDLVADTRKAAVYGIEPTPYREAVRLALQRIEDDLVETRWTSASGDGAYVFEDEQNLLRETARIHVEAPPLTVFDTVSRVGGEQGWPAWDWAWRIRGGIDRLLGGPGTRRGRRSPNVLLPGDAVDFWRVEAVDRPHLLRLRAEMKLPGKAWLQFECKPAGEGTELVQTAFFEPKGLAGMLYWKSLYPVHRLLFRDMVEALAKQAATVRR